MGWLNEVTTVNVKEQLSAELPPQRCLSAVQSSLPGFISAEPFAVPQDEIIF